MDIRVVPRTIAAFYRRADGHSADATGRTLTDTDGMHDEFSPRPPRCDHCGEVIGVYDPLVLVSAGEAKETTLAADPDLSASEEDTWYHSSCYRLASEQT